VPVTTRALIQRLNRRLAREDQQVHAYRGGRWESDLGRYYIVNMNRNVIVARHVNLEALGRDLEVLRPWEALAAEIDR
jgi:hypothetical protein